MITNTEAEISVFPVPLSKPMKITRIGSEIDVWFLTVAGKVHLRTLSFRTLSRRTDKVGSFMPRYKAMEQPRRIAGWT